MTKEMSDSPIGLDLFDSLGLCEALMHKEQDLDASMATET